MINWFVAISEILSLVPTGAGVLLRRIWYCYSLKKCGWHVSFEILSACRTRDVELGNWIGIGRNCWLGQCSLGSNITIANNCTFLSGRYQHGLSREKPMIQQKGELKHIIIGSDIWIGTGSIITCDIPDGCVVGAGSVVLDSPPPYSIIAGVPAKVIGERK